MADPVADLTISKAPDVAAPVTSPGPTGTSQYIRKVGLVVFSPQTSSANAGPELVGTTGASQQNGLDLSQLRIRFRVEGMDFDRPKTAVIRVYNLSDATAQMVQKEFQTVMLQAGYENGNYAQIFTGTIKQTRKGRENAIDTFLDIFAADGDLASNQAVVNKSLAVGSKLSDRAQVAIDAMKANGATGQDTKALQATGGILPRGKVLFGMARDYLGDAADTGNCSWSIVDGKVVFTPLTGYNSGEAVVLTAKTGMVGIPEATNDGVHVRCLLNPLIKIGTRVQIDNASINQTQVNQQGFPAYTDLNFFASTTEDGFYRALVVAHFGDTRGNDWYTDLTCLAIDASAAAAQSVQAAG